MVSRHTAKGQGGSLPDSAPAVHAPTAGTKSTSAKFPLDSFSRHVIE
jgi:hypothetical protein